MRGEAGRTNPVTDPRTQDAPKNKDGGVYVGRRSLFKTIGRQLTRRLSNRSNRHLFLRVVIPLSPLPALSLYILSPAVLVSLLFRLLKHGVVVRRGDNHRSPPTVRTHAEKNVAGFSSFGRCSVFSTSTRDSSAFSSSYPLAAGTICMIICTYPVSLDGLDGLLHQATT